MADRLSWWVIPGALVVLLRVVTLDAPVTVEPGSAPVVPAAAPVDVARGPVIVRDASGVRSRPMHLPVEGALVLNLPAECAGQRVQLSVWRRLQSGREAKAWLEATPRVRKDAVLPIGGQPAGLYDLEVVYGPADAPIRLVCDQVTVPGTIDLSTPASAPASAPLSGAR